MSYIYHTSIQFVEYRKHQCEKNILNPMYSSKTIILYISSEFKLIILTRYLNFG